MARARNVKPGLFHNEALAECDAFTRLLFIGLWTLADREGRLENRPRRIKAQLFPYDNVDVEPMLKALEEKGFVSMYAIGGEQYMEVVNFKVHQNPHHHESPSKIPPYTLESAVREKALPSTDNGGTGTDIVGSSRASSLIPSSLIPDSLFSDSLIPPSKEKANSDSVTLRAHGRTMEEINTKTLILRLHDDEFVIWSKGIEKLILEENKGRSRNPFRWETKRGFESDMKSLIYKRPDKEKLDILSIAWKELGYRDSWPAYMTLVIRYTVRMSARVKIADPYAYALTVSKKPGTIIGHLNDGLLRDRKIPMADARDIRIDERHPIL